MEAAKWTMETAQWINSNGLNILKEIRPNNDLSQLRTTTLPRARLLIDRAEWGRFKNEELAVLLAQLKDTTYDAEDLLREFGDQALRQKLENADRNIAGQLLPSSFDLLKSWITGSTTRVQEAQSNLDKALDEIEAALNFMGLNVEPEQLMPDTSSVIGVPQVFGRDDQRDKMIKMLGVTTGRDDDRDQVLGRLGVPLTRGGTSAGATRKRAGLPSTSRAKRRKGKHTDVATETNPIVLPIVGIGGVGKTTLAQFIYNDARVKAHFDVRIWVCVSDLFDKRRITKEIIKSIPSEGEFDLSSSLDALHGELMKRLMGKKFLLVLDDIWQNANAEWEEFFKPLRNGIEGSMVIVTTRFKGVAVRVSPVEPVQLEGLPDDIFWEFFQKCAFGNEHPESYPDQLLVIGKNIAKKLCGSPLAAKTLGRLLSMDLTVQHWRTIQDSELWELQHEENEILPALQLSYLYLPQKLKRCFAVCSMFPKDYSFRKDEIVHFWMAHDLVAAPGGSMRLEDMGYGYLDDLRSRFLFQTDPKFREEGKYVMHALIHDMAQSVSVDECFLMQGLSNQRIMPQTVRHMSIEVDNEALRRMEGINHLNKLHSLRFGTRTDCDMSWFNQLSNILFLSLRGCKLVKLPEGICVLNHLRYLDISHSSIEKLPEKFCHLYSLQVFDASSSKLKEIPRGITKLVNLRHLALTPSMSLKLSKMSGLGNMSALQELSRYTVGKNDGRRIGELKGMNQLSGSLSIEEIANVRSISEAAEARLVDKQYLKALVLRWRRTECSSRSAASAENGVLEALCPPPGIEYLEVNRFGGDNFPPSWLKSEDVPTIRKLFLNTCTHLRCLTGINRMQHARLPIKSLTSLRLSFCGLTNVDQLLSPEYLPSIKSIELCCLKSLESLPVHNFRGFVYLQELKIYNCPKLVCSGEMILPTSLQRLYVNSCGELDKSFWPGCLENLASLTILHLEYCKNLESVPLNSINTNNLKCLVLRGCSGLSSIGGPHALSPIQHVDISNCPKLTEVQLPFEKGPRPEEAKELLKFIKER